MLSFHDGDDVTDCGIGKRFDVFPLWRQCSRPWRVCDGLAEGIDGFDSAFPIADCQHAFDGKELSELAGEVSGTPSVRPWINGDCQESLAFRPDGSACDLVRQANGVV